MTLTNTTDPFQAPVGQLSYEQAFRQLEEIVSKLEADEHALELALTLFERGQELARHCASLLDQAELRVQQLSAEELTNFTS